MQTQTPHFRVAGEHAVDALQGGTATALAERPRSRKSAESVFNLSQRTQSLLGVQIVGTGCYVPDNVVTNEDLEEQYGIEPGWVEQRTGILERRHAPPDMATSDMAVEAARNVLRSSRVSADEVDLLVVGTFTPDFQCPSTACLVQDRLGLNAPAFDLQAACSGFMYSMVTAAQFVATGNARTALAIGVDTNSRMVDPREKKVYPLFGDAAGAVLISQGEPHQGLMCYQLGADGGGGPLLEIPAGGSRQPATLDDILNGRQYLHMDGRSVFKWAVRALADTIELVLQKSGMTVDDVSLFLIHQANIRIINNATEQLGIAPDRVVNNLSRYGNTSAASIPLAMDEAVRAGRIQRGDTVLMCGFGAGLTWGTGLFRW